MLDLNFEPFPILRTERLLFRKLNLTDIREVKLMRGNPKTMEFIPRPLIENDQEALEFIVQIDEKIQTAECCNWAIELASNPNEMIGIIGHYRIKPEHYRSEIGYMLRQEFQGNGYAAEATRKITQFGFEVMNLNSIEAVINPKNFASQKVLEKNGYLKEGHFIEKEFYNGQFLDCAVYSLLKRNFK